MWKFRRDPTGFLSSVARRYGDIALIKIGSQSIYLLNHPEFIKDVLVTHQRNFIKGPALQRARVLLGDGLLTSEGEVHLRQRRLIQPVFHRQRIATYAQVMASYAEECSQRWQEMAGPDGRLTLDVSAEMMRLTMRVITKTLFGVDPEASGAADYNQVGAAISSILEMFDLLMSPYFNLLQKLPLPSIRRFQQASADLDRTIQALITARRVFGDEEDLLALLLAAQDSEGDGQGMNDRQVRDEALTLFLAGHETTANALTWTFYLLAKHPRQEARLQAELAQVLNGRRPEIGDLEKLTYTRMVLSESMRLYPPAWVLGREAITDYQVGGYPVPAGSTLLMSQWVMHHDPRYYPEPLRFDPERWRPAALAHLPRYAYFPFGGGPRVCIGEQFAWMEGVLLLATLAQRWRMRLVPGHPVELLPRITLRPKYGMRMQLESIE